MRILRRIGTVQTANAVRLDVDYGVRVLELSAS